ncbi:MAG: exodeoxyribonuclease VII large subunit [Blastochloris sp.]|nr:exodeoxyribonuclease VII large subunit [Blastochloris sp.]
MSTALTVTALTQQIRHLLESSFSSVQVRGEISNFRRQSSGHIYFTLKDADAQIKAVFFRGDVRGLKFTPTDGLSVVVFGELTVYNVRGEYQIRVTRMIPEGKGTLQEQFEALKRKLFEEGLFEETRKKALPFFPQKIAIVTSPTGAALRDFLQILGRRCPRMLVQVFGSKVQGQGAAAEITAAVLELNRLAEVDVIILARGGGSIEDLWAFNDEDLARAIATSTIPIISAVGHEIDFTIADFVADLRAPTPSAAAELVSTSDEEWRGNLLTTKRTLRKEVATQMENQRWTLNQLRDHYVFKEPVRVVEQWFQRVDDLRDRLQRGLLVRREQMRECVSNLGRRWQAVDPNRRFVQLRLLLKAQEDQLRLLSPARTLQRGYTLTVDKEGQLIRSRQEAEERQHLKIRFADGDLPVVVEK